MKTIVSLTEEELVNLIKVIVEQDDDYDNDEEYPEIDYIDAFISYFKQWLINTHGEETRKYPFSYLLKKYSKQFVKEVLNYELASHEEDDKDWVIDKWSMQRFTKNLIKKGLTKIPTMRNQEKFTEKYKKQLDYFVSLLDLPSYCSVKFIENKPYDVKVQLVINFPEMLKDAGVVSWNSQKVEGKLKSYLENYLGVKFGNPLHGNLEFNDTKEELVGKDEWIKEVFNKKIKKELKSLPNSRTLKAVKLEVYPYRVGMSIIYHGGRSWSREAGDFRRSVEEYIEGLGYPKKRFEVKNS